jgi:hypothetical protein
MSLRTLVVQESAAAFLVQLDGLVAPEPAPAEGQAGTDRLITDLKQAAPAVTAGADQNNYPRKERVMTDSIRSAYTAGLRQLADILDDHPEVPLPYDGSQPNAGRITFHFLHLGEQAPAEIAAVRRALGVPLEKNARDDTYFDLHGNLRGLYFTLAAFREDVCRRVVIGKREVEVEEPDPEALAALPVVKVTKTVEDVRWECAPLLAAAESELAEADEQAGAVV